MQSNFWLQTLIISKKNKSLLEFIIRYLNKKGIKARPVWNLINSNKPYRYCPSMNLKNSIEMRERIFNIPSSAGIILSKNECK